MNFYQSGSPYMPGTGMNGSTVLPAGYQNLLQQLGLGTNLQQLFSGGSVPQNYINSMNSYASQAANIVPQNVDLSAIGKDQFAEAKLAYDQAARDTMNKFSGQGMLNSTLKQSADAKNLGAYGRQTSDIAAHQAELMQNQSQFNTNAKLQGLNQAGNLTQTAAQLAQNPFRQQILQQILSAMFAKAQGMNGVMGGNLAAMQGGSPGGAAPQMPQQQGAGQPMQATPYQYNHPYVDQNYYNNPFVQYSNLMPTQQNPMTMDPRSTSIIDQLVASIFKGTPTGPVGA